CRARHGDLSAALLDEAAANGNVTRLRRWEAQLNAALARVTRKQGAVFVALARAFAGHELCSRDERVFYPSLANIATFAAFHPTARGQQGIGQRIAAAVRTLQS